MRKLVGWDRYDSAEALEALNALYAELRLFQNLFQPSMKLLTKVRKGSRLIRRDDRPQTPFARVCACPEADLETVAALRRVLAQTDPFARSQRIDRHLDRLYRLADQAGRESPRGTHPPSALALVRLDIQPPSPAAFLGLGAAHGQKPGAHRGLRSDAHQAGQWRGQGEKRQPEAPESPVRFSDDATTPASVRFSDGLTGATHYSP